MRLSSRSRQLFVAPASLRSSVSRLTFIVPCIQRRTFFWNKQKKENFEAPISNPLTEEYLKRKPVQKGPVRGSLASSSIFEDETIAGPKPDNLKGAQDGNPVTARDPSVMAAALDPDPNSRARWERKMVIREIHKRGRLSRTQLIKRQERELLSKSHDIKTSVKKLGPLARQIAGKSVEEAIVQMRFSKKKAAYEVRRHLEHARNEAIVKRGMGLGPVDDKKIPKTEILTKDGKRIKVEDPTSLYIDQAWVGKGDYGQTPDYRARGQVHMMKNPSTHIAVILKEEATRLRQHEERQEKIRNRKIWVQMPNRPITSQRQYYSW